MKHTYLFNEKAVSPVVGVMLMLVVTIIIAAVVSGYAGSLVSGEKKAPQISAETSIVNTGYYYGSQFNIVVTGVSEPIPSKDLKIATSWKASNGVRNSTTVVPGVTNTWYSGSTSLVAPWATGPGITSFGMFNTKTDAQMFGNYTLAAGTVMRAYPAGSWGPRSDPATYGGYGPGPDPTYNYTSGTYVYGSDQDGMQAVLGYDWNNLRQGDIVNVKIIHTPTGKVIYEQSVAVRGG